MASRRIEDLTPSMQEKVQRWLDLVASAGIPLLISCTYRSPEEQEALYLQGREPLDVVNAAREKVGLYLLTSAENRIVTKVRHSKHTDRKALDFVILKNGRATWDLKADVNADGAPDYEQAGRLAQEVGLVWGGDWNGNGVKDESFVDYPHVEEK
jgi:peptidoglycan L-alanyl-D-glutamate endopeptidase CwlK